MPTVTIESPLSKVSSVLYYQIAVVVVIRAPKKNIACAEGHTFIKVLHSHWNLYWKKTRILIWLLWFITFIRFFHQCILGKSHSAKNLQCGMTINKVSWKYRHGSTTSHSFIAVALFTRLMFFFQLSLSNSIIKTMHSSQAPFWMFFLQFIHNVEIKLSTKKHELLSRTFLDVFFAVHS